MESHNRPDTVGIFEAVDPSDTVVVQVVTYRNGDRGHRWIATYNKDALGERSAYFQARKMAATIAEGHGYTVVDKTQAVVS